MVKYVLQLPFLSLLSFVAIFIALEFKLSLTKCLWAYMQPCKLYGWHTESLSKTETPFLVILCVIGFQGQSLYVDYTNNCFFGCQKIKLNVWYLTIATYLGAMVWTCAFRLLWLQISLSRLLSFIAVLIFVLSAMYHWWGRKPVWTEYILINHTWSCIRIRDSLPSCKTSITPSLLPFPADR